MKYHLITILGLFIFTFSATAQEWKSLDSDALFLEAREEAFNGKREQAREKLRFILEKSPNYHDVRILLARTYAWDGDRKTAIAELTIVLNENSRHEDALSAMIDAYSWDDQPKMALQTAETALKTYPNSEDFLLKKANMQQDLGEDEDAMNTVNQLLLINPANEAAIALRESLSVSGQLYAAGAYLSYQVYSVDAYDPALFASLQLRRTNNWGSSIIRGNYSHRFGESGVQGEIDLYPRIRPGMYAYLNYGYSASNLFPNHRIGAELFSKLPKSTEGSLGLRYLIFDTSTKVTIYTGSFGVYYRSFWFSFRPYITPDKDAGTSVSYNLTARKYFSNPETYLTVTAGIGYSPENILQSSSGLSADQIFVLNSQKIDVGFQKALRNKWLIIGDINLAHQELSFDVGNFMWIITTQAGVNYKF